MKMYQLKELSGEELTQKKYELEEELFNLRLTAQVKKLANPSQLRNLRRDIARINTLLRQYELTARKQEQQDKQETTNK